MNVSVLNSNSFNIAKRLINSFGKLVSFQRKSLNEFGEADGELAEIVKIKALYHNSTANDVYKMLTIEDSGKVNSLQTEMLFCEYNPEIKKDDFCVIEGQLYKVSGTFDFYQAKAIMDVSLEAIQNE